MAVLCSHHQCSVIVVVALRNIKSPLKALAHQVNMTTSSGDGEQRVAVLVDGLQIGRICLAALDEQITYIHSIAAPCLEENVGAFHQFLGLSSIPSILLRLRRSSSRRLLLGQGSDAQGLPLRDVLSLDKEPHQRLHNGTRPVNTNVQPTRSDTLAAMSRKESANNALHVQRTFIALDFLEFLKSDFAQRG
jgi:hypothetical protein